MSSRKAVSDRAVIVPTTPPKNGGSSRVRSVTRVTTPRLPPPPPFRPQKRSGFVQALAMRATPNPREQYRPNWATSLLFGAFGRFSGGRPDGKRVGWRKLAASGLAGYRGTHPSQFLGRKADSGRSGKKAPCAQNRSVFPV